MISIEERLNYYIGDTKGPYTEPFDHKRGYDVPICVNWENYRINHNIIHPNTAYPIDVVRLLRYNPSKLWVCCGDTSYTGPMYPIFTKFRDTWNPDSKGIIVDFESVALWKPVFAHEDPPWEYKKPELIWRGTDTSRGIRLNFVKKYQPIYDVGFSRYVQDSVKDPDLYKKEYLRNSVQIPEMLKYKYLPVVEGNDRSSSLYWILACNSVPLMPIPRYHSWICEKYLESGKHYVEVKSDWSDLPEKLEWCRSHDEECKQIAEEGKKFMLQFMNKHVNDYIESKLVEFAKKI